MDEGERQRRFREADERNTARQEDVLHVPYVDLRDRENDLPLLKIKISG